MAEVFLLATDKQVLYSSGQEMGLDKYPLLRKAFLFTFHTGYIRKMTIMMMMMKR